MNNINQFIVDNMSLVPFTIKKYFGITKDFEDLCSIGYIALIKAAKSRAKGITPRCVDSNAIYNNIELSDAAEGITATEIDDAKKRKGYLANAVNVWKKDRNGFYI